MALTFRPAAPCSLIVAHLESRTEWLRWALGIATALRMAEMHAMRLEVEGIGSLAVKGFEEMIAGQTGIPKLLFGKMSEVLGARQIVSV